MFWQVTVVVHESDGCVVMCIKSHVMCGSGQGSGASKLWIQVVSGSMYGEGNCQGLVSSLCLLSLV